MKKFSLISLAMLIVSLPTIAGGLLTNTNQNATFLRNPARGAVIAIDGVYSNPAGIAFLPEGFHLSLSWQAAWQKRQITTNLGTEKLFEGSTAAPVIPSFQAAYVFNDKWSLSAQFAIGGGGGKCDFAEGLPMFEQVISGLAGSKPYSLKQNLVGEQYMYAMQVGATYKLTDNFAVFGGVRGVLASNSYTGALNNITVDGKNAAQYGELAAQAKGAAEQYAAAAQQYAAAGMTAEAAAAAAAAEQYAAAATQAGTAAVMLKDYKLDCSQKDFGITPIVGFDWMLGNLNIGVKYEFRTKIELENEANNSENLAALAGQVSQVAVYADGAKVRADIPALLTVAAQYSISPTVRVMGGYHQYFDTDAEGGATAVSKNTWEVNFGAEWDINDKWLISGGYQRTQYGFEDEDMVDTSFNVSSDALAIGGAYKFNENMRLNFGYMHSFFVDHEVEAKQSVYTRKNDAVGISFDIRF
ncbi:MAG: outer membrane beta-barrel protein [Bacteroides sp.]|nr:outer membrane beta-barrel protein [Bacteroides sp.]